MEGNDWSGVSMGEDCDDHCEPYTSYTMSRPDSEGEGNVAERLAFGLISKSKSKTEPDLARFCMTLNRARRLSSAMSGFSRVVPWNVGALLSSYPSSSIIRSSSSSMPAACLSS